MIIENYEFIKCVIGIVALILCCIMLGAMIYCAYQAAKLEKEQRKELAARMTRLEEINDRLKKLEEIDKSKDTDNTNDIISGGATVSGQDRIGCHGSGCTIGVQHIDETITHNEVKECSETITKWANYEITTDEAANMLKIGKSTIYKNYGHLRRNNKSKK